MQGQTNKSVPSRPANIMGSRSVAHLWVAHIHKQMAQKQDGGSNQCISIYIAGEQTLASKVHIRAAYKACPSLQ